MTRENSRKSSLTPIKEQSMFNDLKPEETELVGMWLDLGIKVTGDAVADRVE